MHCASEASPNARAKRASCASEASQLRERSEPVARAKRARNMPMKIEGLSKKINLPIVRAKRARMRERSEPVARAKRARCASEASQKKETKKRRLQPGPLAERRRPVCPFAFFHFFGPFCKNLIF